MDIKTLAEGPMLTPAQRKQLFEKAVRDRAHFMPPGTGPTGETCRTCAHYTLVEHAKVYRKCGRMRTKWTGGPATDIRAGDAACSGWEKQ